MTTRLVLTAIVATLTIISGCATKPDKIGATYVSPLTYENYSCGQLRAEASRVSSRAAQAVGVQQKKADRDAAAVGVGVVLFWPALFFIKGNGASEAEVGRLKGEMDAIEKVSTKKGCDIQFKRAAPPKKQKPPRVAD